jgi:hypothetical protein
MEQCLFLHRASGTAMIKLITDITKVKAVISVHVDQLMPSEHESPCCTPESKIDEIVGAVPPNVWNIGLHQVNARVRKNSTIAFPGVETWM